MDDSQDYPKRWATTTDPSTYILARARGQLPPTDARVPAIQAIKPATSAIPPITLADFSQRTFYRPLDAWQRDMCDRLQDVAATRGRRILIHCMPQAGKTVIVSQRFPAYALGINPVARIRVLMYNITHAKNKSGRITKDLMSTSAYKLAFPNQADLYVSPLSRNEEWETRARRRIGDGQSSFKCFGLETGATGEGGDLWIFDDPYPSAAQAFSDTYNGSVWRSWDETVKPRLGPNDNVVIMFHRYQVNDLAGMLLEREAEDWELWRYAAIADGDYRVETTGKNFPCLPLGRPMGQPLSPRYDREWYAKKQKSGFTWRGQFQGRPTEEDGDQFDCSADNLKQMYVDDTQVPAGLKEVRAWDFAATEGGGARSAGIKMCGPDAQGFFYVLHSKTGQKSTFNRMMMVKAQAARDGAECEVGIPQDPGSAGKDTVFLTGRELSGFAWWSFPTRQDKIVRARPYSDAWNIGLIKIVRGSWNGQFIECHRQFPNGVFKDEVDAAADAFKRLARKRGRGRGQNKSSSYALFGG